MLKRIIKILIYVILGILSLFGIYHLFTGGATTMADIIKQDGFWSFIKQFFGELIKGIQMTLGL